MSNVVETDSKEYQNDREYVGIIGPTGDLLFMKDLVCCDPYDGPCLWPDLKSAQNTNNWEGLAKGYELCNVTITTKRIKKRKIPHSIHCRGYRGTDNAWDEKDCDCGATIENLMVKNEQLQNELDSKQHTSKQTVKKKHATKKAVTSAGAIGKAIVRRRRC